MQQKILIAYATRYGATEGIARRIGEILQAQGLSVEVLAADEAGTPGDYAAVVLGSAVYAGNWLKSAAEYLQSHEAALAQRPVWLFSSGPTGEGDPVELMKGWRFPETLQPIADRIQPRDIAFFGGVLDPSKMNFAEKLIIKAMKAPTGDFRDWDAIEAWAQGIAAGLKG